MLVARVGSFFKEEKSTSHELGLENEFLFIEAVVLETRCFFFFQFQHSFQATPNMISNKSPNDCEVLTRLYIQRCMLKRLLGISVFISWTVCNSDLETMRARICHPPDITKTRQPRFLFNAHSSLCAHHLASILPPPRGISSHTTPFPCHPSPPTTDEPPNAA